MKRTPLSKTVRTIGLIAILSAIQGMSLAQTAQAQAIPAGKPGSVCSDAYFANPDFMYSSTLSPEQKAAFEKLANNPARIAKRLGILAKGTTFSVALDAPVGYIAKKANGKTIEIPPKIDKEIYWASFNANRDPNGTRRRVDELNQKYAQYATFGQQLTLILSPEQIKENTKMTREDSAYLAAVLTPQQKKEEQNRIKASAKEMGMCPALFNPNSMRSVNIQVGARPDLDKRLREDKTGATFFK
jgi:hypothetical protein